MNKKLCMGLAALTSAFMLTGCFGKDDPPPANPPLTIAQQNEAYTTLRTISSRPLYDTTSQSGYELSVKAKIGVKSSTDFSQSGLSATDIEDLKENILSQYVDVNLNMGAREVAGLKPDNTGYLKSSVNFFGVEYPAGQEITKKEGDNYYTYTKADNGTKIKALVDEHYAKNTYGITNLFGSDEDATATMADFATMQDLLTSITENETLDNFKLIATDLSKDALYGSQDNEYSMLLNGVDFTNATATSTVNITLTDGVYELKTTMTIDDIASTTGTKNNLTDIDTDISVKFDNNTIKNLSVDVVFNQETTEKCSDAFEPEDYNVTFNDNNTLKTNVKLSTHFSIGTGSFNNNLTTQSLNGYTGTGDNGEIENREVEISFECANAKEMSIEDPYTATFGDAILPVFDYAKEDTTDLDFSEFDNVKLYWDKECQREVVSTDTIPSHNVTLYYKLEVPDTKAYAYVTIKTKYGSMTSYSYEYDMYDSNETLTFSDFTYRDIVEVKVTGEVVTAETITLENKQFYNIVITCVSE